MRKIALFMLIVAGALPAAEGSYAQQVSVGADTAAHFVRVEGKKFTINSNPYHYVGVNLWFGLYLGVTKEGRSRLERELDQLQQLGITNVRVMASSEGPNTGPQHVKPAVQPRPGEYNERLLHGLDVLLAEMQKRDMHAVLVLNNFFQWSGGMAQYVSWATGTSIPYPQPEQGGASWDEFQKYATRFYVNANAQKLFMDYMNKIVHRENSVTGTLYRDDPTIMAWQLANEPRSFDRTEAYVQWVRRAAGFLQLVDDHHLVSLGGEGKLFPYPATAFDRVSRLSSIDYLTMHLWIENWGWYEPPKPESTFPTAVGKAEAYLADHVRTAGNIGKPLVLEEFGVSRDGGSYEQGASTHYRNRFFRIIMETATQLAQDSTAMAGLNVWSWAGEGRPVRPGKPWHRGEPFIGDPPHEKQGWYSIYNQDKSTLQVLKHYAGKMSQVRETE